MNPGTPNLALLLIFPKKEIPLIPHMRGKEPAEEELLVDSDDGQQMIVCEEWGLDGE